MRTKTHLQANQRAMLEFFAQHPNAIIFDYIKRNNIDESTRSNFYRSVYSLKARGLLIRDARKRYTLTTAGRAALDLISNSPTHA